METYKSKTGDTVTRFFDSEKEFQQFQKDQVQEYQEDQDQEQAITAMIGLHEGPREEDELDDDEDEKSLCTHCQASASPHNLQAGGNYALKSSTEMNEGEEQEVIASMLWIVNHNQQRNAKPKS